MREELHYWKNLPSDEKKRLRELHGFPVATFEFIVMVYNASKNVTDKKKEK